MAVSYPEPRSVYIHVPFCGKRCGYCSFPLVADRDYLINGYLDALQTEIERTIKLQEVDTLFLGGGTPTHLALPQLERLFDVIESRFRLSEGGEFTCEANPDDLTVEMAACLASRGVNRLSLGVQSFDNDKLAKLDRVHTKESTERAIEISRQRFRNISLDLMFGVANEKIESWRAELERFVELELQHVSTYELTIEKGTRFWSLNKLAPQKLGSDENADFYELTIDLLTQNGFQHYEISSFSLPQHACRHNRCYWDGSRYWAVGPGAASFVGDQRRVNHPSVAEYIRRIKRGDDPAEQIETLSPRQIALDLLVFGLRQIGGCRFDVIEQQTGFSFEEVAGDQWPKLSELGLLEKVGDKVRLTHRGLLVADWVTDQLVDP